MTSSCVLTKLQSPCWIVPRSFRSWHDLSRTWSNVVMRSRIVTNDLLMIVSRTWSNAGLEECTASPGRDTSTGCFGWSRLCDHAAAVPAVRRVLRAFGSVPRHNGGRSSCMQILVRIVHTVQQTVDISQVQFWGWLLTRLLLCNDRCPGWVAQKTGVSAVAVLVGVVQFLDKVVVPVGATIGGRAMLGSTMETCNASSRVTFGRIFTILYMKGLTRLQSSIHVLPAHRRLRQWHVPYWFCWYLMHLALCSHDCRQSCR